MYHNYLQCKCCYSRISDVSDVDYQFHDIDTYSENEDIELKKTKSYLSSPTNFVCSICDVTCFTEELLQTNISGRKPKEKMSGIYNDKPDKKFIKKPENKIVNQIPPKVLLI